MYNLEYKSDEMTGDHGDYIHNAYRTASELAVENMKNQSYIIVDAPLRCSSRRVNENMKDFLIYIC